MHVSFPWSDELWAPTVGVARRAEKAQLMTVRVQVSPPQALDGAWKALSQDCSSDGEALLDGGASLLRSGTDLVEVCSGGEDVLGSLSWTLNQTLLAAVREADATASVTVVDEAPGKRPANR